MAPVIARLAKRPNLESSVCVTGQHREMLDQVLDLFGIVPDHDLNVMCPGQSLTQLTSHVILGLEKLLADTQPEIVLVHGDTTTTFSAAVSAFYQKIPIAHIEAGLRTGNRWSPWPEELNRKLTGHIATLHYAPTDSAKRNLLKEGIDEKSILVTGNTVIDALFETIDMIRMSDTLRMSLSKRHSYLDPNKRLVLVTCHRRESFGDALPEICNAIATLAHNDNVEFVFPVHLNPNIREPVERYLGSVKNVHIMEPISYLDFVFLMKGSYLILTDSGGVQEEAPSLGVPVLVMRQFTERPEAVEAGTVRLVGTSSDSIVGAAREILNESSVYKRMSLAHNPYGDGKAAERIVSDIERYLFARESEAQS